MYSSLGIMDKKTDSVSDIKKATSQATASAVDKELRLLEKEK